MIAARGYNKPINGPLEFVDRSVDSHPFGVNRRYRRRERRGDVRSRPYDVGQRERDPIYGR